MAGAPQPRAVLGLRGPCEVAAAVLARELLDVARVLLDARGRAVELEEQRRRLRVPEPVVRVDGAHHRRVEQLAAGDRHARLDDRDRRADRVLGGRERADGGGDRLGDRPQPQRQLGDDPERPLRSDEQVGEVVAGARLARPRAGADDAPVRQHHLEREHVLAHRAVADGVGPRGAGRRHAAQRRVRSRVDREERAVAADALLQHRARDAGLHGDVEVLDAHAQDLRPSGSCRARRRPRRRGSGPRPRSRCRTRRPGRRARCTCGRSRRPPRSCAGTRPRRAAPPGTPTRRARAGREPGPKWTAGRPAARPGRRSPPPRCPSLRRAVPPADP